jgi:hypothetical protein
MINSIIKLVIALTIIFATNCAILFPPRDNCRENSYSCQQIDGKLKACQECLGQQQTNCYEELKILQEKCSDEINRCHGTINTKTMMDTFIK